MTEERIAILVKLQLPDGTEAAHVADFAADEWRILEAFSNYAAELSRTALVSTDPGELRLSISASDAGVATEVAMPDADHYRTLLHLMRPFVLQKEPTHFGKIVNILRSRIDHPAFRAYFDRQKAIFAGQRQQAMKLFSNGTVINSTETLDLWLNGFEYHRDANKRTQFEALQSETLPVEVSLNLLAGIVLDRVRAVLDIGNAIYNVRRNLAICPFPGDEPNDAPSAPYSGWIRFSGAVGIGPEA
jgi:hypothetical protein